MVINDFKIHKVVSSLPSTLEPNTIYLVRVGDGFDLYCSDTTGSIAHKVNDSGTFAWDGGNAFTEYYPLTLNLGGAS